MEHYLSIGILVIALLFLTSAMSGRWILMPITIVGIVSYVLATELIEYSSLTLSALVPVIAGITGIVLAYCSYRLGYRLFKGC